MLYYKKVAACCAIALASPLTGCILATNGLDYNHPMAPAPAPPPVASTPPPPPPPPPCQPAAGQAMTLEGCKSGDKIVLHGVNFEVNKAKLTVNAKTLLDQVAAALTAKADIKVEIDGYTDSTGSSAHNLKLSLRRAEAVQNYLVARGIDGGRLSAAGMGDGSPIADNATEEGRELNRRVELKVK